MAAESLLQSFCDELAKIPPFDRVAATALRQLAQHAELAYYPANTLVYPASTPAATLYLIKDGRVSAGDDEFSRGDVFPLELLLTGDRSDEVHSAVEDSFIYLIPVAAFDALRQQSAPFADYCLDRMGHLLVRSRQALQASLALDERHTALNMTLGQIMSQPVTCAPTTSLQQALQHMQDARVGSMLVTDGDARALGIYTLQDLLRTVLAGVDLSTPMSGHMHAPLVSLPPEALATDAAILMANRRIRHIPVVAQQRLVGMVSERDLYGLQRVSLGSIERQLETASQPDEFAAAMAQIHRLTINLLAQGLAAEPLARLTSTLFDRLTVRLLAQYLAPLAAEGIGLCWVVFGSEGRQEQTLVTDQDNGLIFSVPPGQTADAVRARLLPVCAQINQLLAHCGITLCKGGIMAMNAACCLSLKEWQQRFTDWIDGGEPDSLLAASIFFDFRPLWGDESLSEALDQTLRARIRERPRFLWLMTRNALRHEPPLGLIRDFVTQKHHGESVLDLKAAGTVFFVDAARILALAAGIRPTATSERLRQAGGALGLPAKRVDSWINAFQFLQMLRLRYQESQLAQGQTADNLIHPDQLTDLDRRILREALSEARWLQRQLAQRWPA